MTAESNGATLPPPRDQWPEPQPETAGGHALTEVILASSQLHGRLMEAAQELAAAGDMTAAWWQVLGGVLDQPHSVAEVGRRMGMTRQGVQRIADTLVERGLAEYRDNPSHRRAKLLACTESGYWAIRRISIQQTPWAARIGDAVGADELLTTLATMRRLIDLLEPAAADVEGRPVSTAN